ncbi:pilus assembly protein PilB [Chlorogloeopsis sp. ULAP01]|uniref:GspE/PulE/PilB domain-containing protein n=1 Tax=Chlorogloeopsis sp. ULAP01 TaxID=3056483 RepID=UPI0025AB1CF1|nr:pilus assembly protein PilB [Chlorogloeopsis sp. ULAP01]MDM9382850.1 pilus assembly protein PilB [Chlorogloeopsis sp. ULAP01]
MSSSEGKQTDTEEYLQTEVVSNTNLVEEQELENEQIFPLIESLLSFEACLYHQILPLKIEDNCLWLGMVNQEDSAALDYVRRILSYINCNLLTVVIRGDIHRNVLSAFLNHKNTFHPAQQREYKPWETIAKNQNTAETAEQALSSTNVNLQPTQQPTKILDEALTTQNTPSHEDSLLDATGDRLLQNPPDSNCFTTVSKNEAKQEDYSFELASTDNVPVLSAPEPQEFSPVEHLLNLPPKKLLEELLGRVLAGGIGRLYLERLPYDGKILWSENGVLQSVLEKVPLSVFQGLMNELKRFGSLPVTKLEEPKQIEKECLYKQERLLLRLRIMLGMHGEEATLQVLRGAALKFYQQQMVTRLSRDALGISQQLSYKLHELQERLLLNHNISSSQLDNFNVLNQTLYNLEQYIRKLEVETLKPSIDRQELR